MKQVVVEKASICFVLFLFIQAIASAQVITGTVTDEQNQPIEFANIVLLSPPDSSFVQGTISHENGSFQLSVPHQDTYILKVSSVGYQTICKNTQAG